MKLVHVRVKLVVRDHLDDPAVAFMLDGIYIARQTTPMYLGFYDIKRIEVLRGPQSTLYGRSASAGLLNIVTQGPSAEFEARVGGLITTGRAAGEPDEETKDVGA